MLFIFLSTQNHLFVITGSDLDGDEYSVFWHEYMLFDHNEAAMNYPLLTADPLEHVPTVSGLCVCVLQTSSHKICIFLYNLQNSEMVDFFVCYLSQDAIGTIGSAHLSQSDRLGLFSQGGFCDLAFILFLFFSPSC
jgi:hypothetical protein